MTARLDELRTKLTRDGNFEKTFRTLLDSAARYQTYWPFQVPLYLRELFWAVSLDYLQGSSKFDTLVRGFLESSFERILFINVNYNLLLEDALANYQGHELDSLGAYVSDSNRWMFVKPHGSVNWLTGVPIERVSILLGHESVRTTEKNYAPWVRSRQEQLEADLTRAWGLDPVIAAQTSQTRGTRQVHGKKQRSNSQILKR